MPYNFVGTSDVYWLATCHTVSRKIKSAYVIRGSGREGAVEDFRDSVAWYNFKAIFYLCPPFHACIKLKPQYNIGTSGVNMLQLLYISFFCN